MALICAPIIWPVLFIPYCSSIFEVIMNFLKTPFPTTKVFNFNRFLSPNTSCVRKNCPSGEVLSSTQFEILRHREVSWNTWHVRLEVNNYFKVSGLDLNYIITRIHAEYVNNKNEMLKLKEVLFRSLQKSLWLQKQTPPLHP